MYMFYMFHFFNVLLLLFLIIQVDFSLSSGFLAGRKFKANLAEIDLLFTDKLIELNLSGNKFLNGNISSVGVSEFLMVNIPSYSLEYISSLGLLNYKRLC